MWWTHIRLFDIWFIEKKGKQTHFDSVANNCLFLLLFIMKKSLFTSCNCYNYEAYWTRIVELLGYSWFYCFYSIACSWLVSFNKTTCPVALTQSYTCKNLSCLFAFNILQLHLSRLYAEIIVWFFWILLMPVEWLTAKLLCHLFVLFYVWLIIAKFLFYSCILLNWRTWKIRKTVNLWPSNISVADWN